MRKMKIRLSVIACSILGGRSPKTGKPVGRRHKWSGEKWGEGECIYCGRRLNDVLIEDKS